MKSTSNRATKLPGALGRIGRVVLVTLLLAATPVIAGAQQRSGFGLGVMVGEPTGVSTISWLTGGNALDMVAAWSFQGSGSVYIHADYQFHGFVENPLTTFGGLGAFVLLQDNPGLGLRVPLGISFLFQSIPFDLFFEVAPGLKLVPATSFFVGSGVGFRFYLR